MEDEEQAKTEFESRLAGKRVAFTWNAEDAKYGRAFDKGNSGDDGLLAPLAAEFDFADFLSDKPVVEGDTWNVDAAAFRACLAPGGDLSFRPKQGEPDKKDLELAREFSANLEGTVTVTCKGGRKQAARELVVLGLLAELETHADATGDDESFASYEEKHHFEGEILWDAKAGHAVRVNVTSTVEGSILLKTTQEIEGGDVLQLEAKFATKGEYTFETRFEG